MKTKKIITYYANAICFVSYLIFSNPANAEWIVAHGNVGQVEYKTNNTNAYTGAGLFIKLASLSNNWIHLPVASKFNTTVGARFIRLMVKKGPEAYINSVHVWNGPYKVKAFDGLVDTGSGWKEMQFDLGSKIIFNKGLSISVGISSLITPDPVPERYEFIFSSVAANFVP